MPLPVPYPYVQGFDLMLYTPTTGITVGNIVMLGNFRGLGYPRSDGFAAYYVVTYLLKEPLGMQLLLLLSLWLILRHRPPATSQAADGLLLASAAVFLIMLSFFNRAQIGIRHILPVLVITVILSGGALSDWPLTSRRRKILIGGCLLWTLLSVGSYFPHMIPYFNEIVTDRKLAYRYLGDSNLHWDQETWVVQKFLRSNPDVILDPPAPVTGRVLVNGNLIGGVRPNKGTYWLRQLSLTPVAHVGYGYFLFDVRSAK